MDPIMDDAEWQQEKTFAGFADGLSRYRVGVLLRQIDALRAILTMASTPPVGDTVPSSAPPAGKTMTAAAPLLRTMAK